MALSGASKTEGLLRKAQVCILEAELYVDHFLRKLVRIVPMENPKTGIMGLPYPHRSFYGYVSNHNFQPSLLRLSSEVLL